MKDRWVTTRDAQTCDACDRSIDAGERCVYFGREGPSYCAYRYRCAHCDAALRRFAEICGDMGIRRTTLAYSTLPEASRLLRWARAAGCRHEAALAALLDGVRRDWRNVDGSLMPVPTCRGTADE